MNLREERMSDIFTKYHIEGLPFEATLHRFTAPDLGAPHDHPFGFTTHIISGSYIERVYTVKSNGSWIHADYYRGAGTSHSVEANHIHQLIELPEGDCYTLMVPKSWEQTPGFYQFNKDDILFRYWNEEQFRLLKQK